MLLNDVGITKLTHAEGSNVTAWKSFHSSFTYFMVSKEQNFLENVQTEKPLLKDTQGAKQNTNKDQHQGHELMYEKSQDL